MAKLIIFLLLPSLLFAFDEWSPTTKALMGATLFSFAFDGISTHQFLKEGIPEKNRFLGPHPSDTKLALYLGGVFIGLCGLVHVLPDPLRPYVIVPFLLVELKVSRHNFMITKNF